VVGICLQKGVASFVSLGRDKQTILPVPPEDTFTIAKVMLYLVDHNNPIIIIVRKAKKWRNAKSFDKTLPYPLWNSMDNLL
jgi:hypothetical protein